MPSHSRGNLEADEIGGMRVGRVQFGGITRQTFLDFVPEAQPGDYVLVHVGFAISTIDEEEALRVLRDLESLGPLADELGPVSDA